MNGYLALNVNVGFGVVFVLVFLGMILLTHQGNIFVLHVGEKLMKKLMRR